MGNIERFNTPVSANIQRIISEKGLKKQYVAKKSDLNAQELSDMLNNRRVIKVNDVPKIARALEVSVSELFA